jgi:secretion/DNA translocation related TadE-like protein
MTTVRDQRGSATLLVLAMAGVLLLVGCALGVVAALIRAHRVAQSAADLAALAGAQALQLGRDGCGRAAEVAEANDARLTACSRQGSVVTLSVTVTGPHWLGQKADLTARSRAGPVAGERGSAISPVVGDLPTAWPRGPAAHAVGDPRGGAAALASRRPGRVTSPRAGPDPRPGRAGRSCAHRDRRRGRRPCRWC